MWQTNLKIVSLILGTVALYTLVANWIPQVESEVPEELTFTGEVTPDDLARAGEELYAGAGGCIACHGSGTRAPNLLTDEGGTGPIGARCGERVPGEDCKEYLWAAMVDPAAYVVEGYGAIMPDMSRTLSEAQIWAIIAYLQSQGGEITVDASDMELGSDAAGGPGGAAGRMSEDVAATGPGELGDQPGVTEGDPHALLEAHTCLACHQLDGAGGPIGPSFDDVGARLTPDEIRQSILYPAADTSPGYEAVAGTMPATFGQQLTAAQLEAMVTFLSAQGGG